MPDPLLKLSSLVARSVVEYAASLRSSAGDPGFMVTVTDPATGRFRTFFTTSADPCSDAVHVVTPVSTRSVQPRRPPVETVQIRAKGMATAEELVPTYDAVFWSEAAVEKFVLPYYASKGQWAAAHVLHRLSKHFYGFVPGSGDEAEAGDPQVPFALAHIPRSDYVDLTETGAVGADLGLIHHDPVNGGVAHRRLSEFL